MPRTPKKKPAPRKRRTAEEARSAILDAAEKRLVEAGPAGIRLQEVAADVGVSHPTVLHHFGNREALVDAVVARALDSLHLDLLRALQDAKPGPDQATEMLERVSDTLIRDGHARAFLWLALSGYPSGIEDARIRRVAEAVHEVRKAQWAGRKEPLPPFEDTYFTVLLPALTLMTASVLPHWPARHAKDGDPCGPASFRRWLGKLLHEHLDGV